ncbi:hypothetical protein BFW01_g10040 [Lasiodiplodia theobromae]|nr:hypothetical protein BFW01_g10040 [Lasiodiplodia theobromae]
MSLYYEAATILENADNVGGSLTSRIYGKKGLKSKPTAIYALVTEATKWSAVLKDVVEKSGILKLEKKLTPLLAVLLTHDLLISKGGVAAPANHPLKLAITRHKARLSAEFTKLRVKRGFSTLDAFRQHINACAESGISANSDASSAAPSTITEHPRWVRVNAVRTTLDAQLRTTFADYTRKDALVDVMAAPASAKVLHIDAHIPNLLALPPRADLSRVKAYQAGELIIQDKASCFPAYLLNVQPGDGDAIDGCAAPGNKTTHLAAIVAENNKIVAAGGEKKKTPKQRIIACERDKRRSGILEKMVNLAGASSLVTVKQRQDFLNLDPHSPELASVGAILLDPSCSGSGIVSRDDDVKLVLPSAAPAPQPSTTGNATRGKKRKRKGTAATNPSASPQEPAPATLPLTEQETEDTDNKTDDLSARLTSLSSFQLKLLTRAMAFPAARKISYSTCSIHAQENEHVVLRALASGVARARGWRVLRRDEQVEGMRRWNVRGERGACEGVEGVDLAELARRFGMEGEEEVKEVVREACVRGEKGTGEGTMGFFVAGVVGGGGGGVGDGGEVGEDEDEDEWGGFSD